MKLNIKQTVCIGFTFLTIMMLWGVYNWFVPMFLNDFISDIVKGDKILIGVLMALDNFFALFMIPIMSALSDKSKFKSGKRTPFIIIGVVLSAASFALIPLANESGNVWLLIVNILAVLIFMNIYRSPCISLMPDVTPKPLRSKANSVINIMGGIGTAIAYICNLFFAKVNKYVPFFVVSVLMIIFLVLFLVNIKENKMVKEYNKILEENNIDVEEDKKEEVAKGGASATNLKNILLILAAVFLVYMANNAVETWLSLYSEFVYVDVTNVPFNLDPGTIVLIPFGVAVFAAAVPAALIADKMGRKWTVLIGIALLAIAYLIIGLMGYNVGFSYWEMLFFFIGGVGFAFVTINIYPMVVENCAASAVGKYTGHYYTASMLAQSVTPALSGLFMSNLLFNNMKVLFPYCVVFVVLAAICMLFVSDKN